MANKQPQIVTIDGVEHDIEQMTQEQRVLLDHVFDLDRKLGSIDFQRVQLQVGRDSFFSMLKNALENNNEPVKSDASQPE